MRRKFTVSQLIGAHLGLKKNGILPILESTLNQLYNKLFKNYVIICAAEWKTDSMEIPIFNRQEKKKNFPNPPTPQPSDLLFHGIVKR